MPFDIRLGQCFCARFATRDLVVRIDDHAPGGGWVARSLTHGRKVIIKSADQILYRCDENGIQTVADETIPNRRSKAPPPPPKEPAVMLPIPQTPVPQQTGPLPLLDAAAVVLRESMTPLSTREIIALIVARKLWNGGRTAASKRVKNQIAGIGTGQNATTDEFHGFCGRMNRRLGSGNRPGVRNPFSTQEMPSLVGEQNDFHGIASVPGQITLRAEVFDPEDGVIDLHAGRFQSGDPRGGDIEPSANIDRSPVFNGFNDGRDELDVGLLVVGEHLLLFQEFTVIADVADAVRRVRETA